MSTWRQFLVLKGIPDNELDTAEDRVLKYLIQQRIISREMKDNILGNDKGYCPGEKWHMAVYYPEENHFLTANTNGVEVTKGRTVFWGDGRDFEAICCPSCAGNNLECEWGELFSTWMDDPNSALLKCQHCDKKNSISEYNFDPKWALGNFGIAFWGWPLLKVSLITRLALLINCEIEKVEGSV